MIPFADNEIGFLRNEPAKASAINEIQQAPKLGLSTGASFTVWAVWIILLTSFWWDVRVSPSIIMIGSYNLSTSDPSFVAVVIALMFNLIGSYRRFTVIAILVAFLLLLTIVNFSRGLVVDPGAALIWLREDAGLALLLLLALKVPYSDALALRINRAIMTVAAMIAMLILLRYAIARDLFMDADGLKANEGRLISVHGATILAIASGILLARYLAAPRRILSLLGAVGALLITVASGQGTASACALVIFATTFGLSRGTMSTERLIIFLLLLVLAAVVLIVGPELMVSSLNADWAARRLSNVGFRERLWDAVFAEYQLRDLGNQLFGLRAGPNPTIYFDVSSVQIEWQGSRHSMYFGLLSRFGAVGLILYMLAIVGSLLLLFTRREIPRASVHTRGLSIAMLVAALILGYSYELRFEQLLLVFIPFLFLGRQTEIEQPEPRLGALAGEPT